MRQRLRTAILQLVRVLGAPRAYLMERNLPRFQSAPRILLLRPDHLGDMLLTTPILAELRSRVPEAHITMMAGPWSSEVVERHPAIDRLVTCPFPGFQRAAQKPLAPYTLLLRTAEELRREDYDLAINLRPDFWWGAALLYLAGIPRRVGYAIEPGTPFLTQSLPFVEREHATVSNLRLANAGLQALGYESLEEPFTPARYPLVFRPTEEERAWAGQRLAGAGIESATPLVVIHPGTGGEVKLWRAEAWSKVANDLVIGQEFEQAPRVVLTGSPHERPLLDEIAAGMSDAPVLFDQQSVGQLAVLLERADLVLGVDNGPLHLAVAQDRPSLRLFGPTDACIFGPWGDRERHRVIASTWRCPGCPNIPCGRLDFSAEELTEHPCVKRISEQEVEEAITSLLHTHQPLQ